jgi:hypothetical protein
MSDGEPKVICIAPPAPNPDPNPEETLHIRKEGTSKTFKVIAGILAFALLAGVVVAVAASRGLGGASASAETATVTEGSDGSVATATGSGAQHQACVGEIADPQTRWYCQEFLPFADKAVADHHRIDRLEAAGKGSGTPTALWILVICIGLLTVYNTVKIHTRASPPE